MVALQVGLFQLEGFARRSEGHFVKQMYVIKFMSLLVSTEKVPDVCKYFRWQMKWF